MTRVGTKHPFRSDYYARIEAVVIDAFVHGREYTQRALSDAIGKTFGLDAQKVPGRLLACLRALADRGMYEAQAGRFGSKGTQAKGSPTSPHWFNWSGVPIDQASFRLALEPYLADDQVDLWRKEAIRKTLRFFRELPTQCPDDRIMEDSARIPADKLYDLPGAVYNEAIQHFGRQTAKNYRSAVTAVLRYGAEGRRIPMVFPYYFVPDAWAEVKDRCFPLAEAGPSPKYVDRGRHGLGLIRRAAIALYGDGVTLEQITPNRAREIIEHLRVKMGDRDGAIRVASTFRELARTFRLGPYAEERPSDAFFVDTPRGRRPAIFLRDSGDAGDGDDWDALVARMKRMGFPPATIEFLEWYKPYITMSARDLMRRENRGRYPDRKDVHKLTPNSLRARAVAVRAYLGAAVNGLGRAPADLTPEIIFGRGFDEIAHTLIDWWQDRRDALLEDGVDTAIGGGLVHYIVGIGMLCYTRYELLRFERRLKVATIDRPKVGDRNDHLVRVDSFTEEGVAKTPAELYAWESYRSAYALVNKIHARVKEERGVNRADAPEFKDIKIMLANTPPQWFIKVLNNDIERVRDGIRRNLDSYKFHKLVRDTVDLGLHMSTGCRSEESCLLRVDQHFTPERLAARVIDIQAFERKNNKRTQVILQPAYLPDDIMECYMQRSRPFFMRDQYVRPHRVGGKGKLISQPGLVRDHPFFLVSTRGNAYGVMDLEDPAQLLQLLSRAKDHGRNLTSFIAREAVRCHLKLPGRKYELGPHAIRGVFAYALYLLTKSAQVAAHYLGDDEQTVLTNYSAISGVNVDSSALVGVDVRPLLGVAGLGAAPTLPAPDSAPVAVGGPDAEYVARMEQLLADRRAGLVDQAEFDELKAAYRQVYHGGGRRADRVSLAGAA